mmetsp:Transcript_23358/g.78868  ORF Transcript_23358/g.78868 Transcript_23358/m.78868 type:complete len:237 (-) Transcript_23358:925-1635(-)
MSTKGPAPAASAARTSAGRPRPPSVDVAMGRPCSKASQTFVEMPEGTSAGATKSLACRSSFEASATLPNASMPGLEWPPRRFFGAPAAGQRNAAAASLRNVASAHAAAASAAHASEPATIMRTLRSAGQPPFASASLRSAPTASRRSHFTAFLLAKVPPPTKTKSCRFANDAACVAQPSFTVFVSMRARKGSTKMGGTPAPPSLENCSASSAEMATTASTAGAAYKARSRPRTYSQ